MMDCYGLVLLAFLVGGTLGILVMALMVMARDSGRRYPTLPSDSVHPFEATHPLC
jgi:hypothetical protein